MPTPGRAFEDLARAFIADNPWLATICSSHEPALVAMLAREFKRVDAAGERRERERCLRAVATLRVYPNSEKDAELATVTLVLWEERILPKILAALRSPEGGSRG